MSTDFGGRSMPDTVNHWSRVLGVSLRPWSGRSPSSLIVGGIIQLGICVFLLVVGIQLSRHDDLASAAPEIGMLKGWLVMAAIAAAIVAISAASKLVIGVLDLVPRREVTGTVVSVRDRMFGDFLPRFLQRQLFDRSFHNNQDRRKIRTEVVLQTEDGPKQWTVRSARTRRDLAQGSRVRLRVTPLAGHVASVEPLRR